MTMRFLFMLAILFILQSPSLGQKFSIQEGPLSKTKTEPLKIVGLFHGDIISISKQKNKYYLVKYAKDKLDIKSYKQLRLSYKGKKIEFVDFIKVNNSYLLIGRFNNKKTATAYYIAQDYDLEHLSAIGSPRLWSTSIRPESYESRGFFINATSPNQHYSMVINPLKSETKLQNNLLISIFNTDSNTLMQKQLSLDFDLRLFEISDAYIDNNAVIYFAGKQYFDGVQNVKNGKINYQYLVFKYSPKEDELLTYPFENKSKIMLQMRMALNKNNKIICGAITYKNNGNNRDHIESYVLNHSKSHFVMKSQKEISIYSLSDTKLDKDHKSIPIFETQKMVLSENGHLIFLAEQRYISTIYGIPSRYVFSYLQNLAVEIDSTGDINNIYSIKKMQTMLGKNITSTDWKDYRKPIWSGSFSYIFASANNHYYSLYNEATKRLNTDKRIVYYQGEDDKASPLLCLMNTGDKTKCFPLSDNESDKLKIYTNTYFQHQSDLYVIAKKNGGQLLIKIQLY